MDTNRVRNAGDRIAYHLDKIAELFLEPVKLTLVVRNPAHPDGARDVYMTDDDAELAIAALRTSLAKGIEITKGPG